MPAIAVERLLTWTNHTRIGFVHHVTALIFYNITRCYSKQVSVFAVAVATGDIIKYLSSVYGSFVWGIHVRYNNLKYQYGHMIRDTNALTVRSLQETFNSNGDMRHDLATFNIQLLTNEALDMMWYRPDDTNIDRGEAEVNIVILWSISHHIQCLISQ